MFAYEGTTWEPIFEDAPSQSVGAVSIAPSNPDHVWVGGGEANVFRSSMSGVGVHLSPDGGETWERTLYVDERTGVYDLRIDPRNPDVLYAATWERIRRKWMDPKPGPGTSIYKSTAGGETWREIDEGLPADRATHGRIGIDIARSDPDVLYAFLDNHESARTAEEGERDAHGRERENVIKGNGVPNTFVHDLIVHPRDDILVIATHGRGMYAMDARPIQAMARE